MPDELKPAGTEFGRRLLGRMGHVARLSGDAELLLKHNRVAGAALMAALAYEELGKLIDFVWKEWGVEPEGYTRNAHDRKQRAVACLLIVADLYPHAKEMAGKGGIDEADLQRRVEVMLPTKRQKSKILGHHGRHGEVQALGHVFGREQRGYRDQRVRDQAGACSERVGGA